MTVDDLLAELSKLSSLEKSMTVRNVEGVYVVPGKGVALTWSSKKALSEDPRRW